MPHEEAKHRSSAAQSSGGEWDLRIFVDGVDCADCADRLQATVLFLPSVDEAEVLLGIEQLNVRYRGGASEVEAEAAVRRAVEQAGFRVRADATVPGAETEPTTPTHAGTTVAALLAVVALVLFADRLGVIDVVDRGVPRTVGGLIVLGLAWPVLRRIAADVRARRLSAHTLPALGAGAALVVGTWTSAALVLVLVRLADLVERAAIRRGRVAILALEELRPLTANVQHGDHLHTVSADAVSLGAIVVVRPGERVPVDGLIIAGTATVDQSALTGDPVPSRLVTGDRIFAASITHGGVIRVRAETVGANSAFGRVVSAVERAEADRPRLAGTVDRLARWYVPVILAIACAAWLFGRGALSAASVLIIACSCSLIVTVPIATLASIGTAARSGLLIKSGRALESLARVDVLLIDKTGTLTAGAPVVVGVEAIGGVDDAELLELAASAEQHALHPLARAVCRAATERGATIHDVEDFVLHPGAGVSATTARARIAVGSERWLLRAPAPSALTAALDAWREQGFSTMVVARDDLPIGAIAVADRLRPDVEAALRALRAMEIETIEMLTGDHPKAAAALARRLGIACRGGLLPDEKLAAVQAYQKRRLTVAMVGDGTNDVAALATADVGIAIGATGVAVASQAADVVLLHDDWMLVPDAIAIARRAMRLARANLAGSAAYNLLAVTMALSGHVTPVLAAAAHTIPDLGVLANSARLMRNPRGTRDDHRRPAGTES